MPEDAKKSLDTKKKDAASLPKTDLAMREPDGKKCDENINFSAVNKLYLRFPEKGSKIEERAMALLRIFSGKVPCYFYYRDSGRHFRVNGISAGLNPAVVAELVALLGEENVVLK